MLRYNEGKISHEILFEGLLEMTPFTSYSHMAIVPYKRKERLTFKFWANNKYIGLFQFYPKHFRRRKDMILYVEISSDYATFNLTSESE